jgi:hypothetical protein
MSNTLSIQDAHQFTIKQAGKMMIGTALASAFPKRAQQLSAFPLSDPHGFRDKAIMAHLKRKAIKENREDFFERLHQNFWSGQGGAVFADNCDHRFNDLFMTHQIEDFSTLAQIWRENPRQQVVEFGCNSGFLLNYLTTNLEHVQSSLGIEINADQVRRNQESDKFDPRVSFLHADGGRWLLKFGQANTLFVSNGGVLEYFRRERLDEMLAHISNQLKPATFFSVEPVAADHDWSKSEKSVPFGDELSFSHNYTHLFESNGFQIRHQRAVEYQQWKMVATIAVTTA